MKTYNEILADIVDRYAPMMHKVVAVTPMVPWFDNELIELKAKQRKLEKKMLRVTCN